MEAWTFLLRRDQPIQRGGLATGSLVEELDLLDSGGSLAVVSPLCAEGLILESLLSVL